MKATFYATVPRVKDLSRYSETAMNVVRWSDENDLDGVLFFTGAGAVLDPWVAATAAVARSARLTPLVAVNPVYTHPFAAARMVASIAHMFRRPVALNLITGTAVSDLASIGDHLDHDERYARLLEYIEVVMGLLASARPFSYEGRFYTLSRVQLAPALPTEMLPELFVAGQSQAALDVVSRTGATSIGMLPPTLGQRSSTAGASHFGVVTRESNAQAWQAAHAYFPPDEMGARLVEASMANTDSTWKRRLLAIEESSNPAYWTLPFRSGRADCPYVVADHHEVANLIGALVSSGVSSFVLDMPTNAEDFRHVGQAIRLVREAGGKS